MEHVSIGEPDDDGVLVLSIDRPPMNAMDLPLLGAIVEALERVASEAPRALVLAGRADCFSAGADLKAVPGYGPAQQREMVSGINAMALGVYELEFPVVGAITGHAIAGGLVLALCTDIRVASSSGRYGLTEVQVGVPYPQAALGGRKRRVQPSGDARPRARQRAHRRQRMRAPGRVRRGARRRRRACARAARGREARRARARGLRADKARSARARPRTHAVCSQRRSAARALGRLSRTLRQSSRSGDSHSKLPPRVCVASRASGWEGMWAQR